MDTFPKSTLFSGQLLLREAYDQSYGLFDHLGQAAHAQHSTDLAAKRPLALFAYMDAEHDSGTPLNYGFLAQRFWDLDLQKFGITVFDFFDLPREQAKILMEVAEVKLKATDRIAAEITKGMRNM